MSVLHQSISFFEGRNSLRYKSLFQTQYDPSTPGVPQLESGTSLLVPDYRVEQQMEHFPEDLYDLRPESHLVRLMKALLGDSGAGQLRKRYLMARLQTVMSSTHFFDLDAFYGAIFGINRRRYEAIPFNPYRAVATPDEWDLVHVSDSSFRERIVALAHAIPQGATPRGMQAAAEAITSSPCDVIENWARMDYYLAHGYDPEPGAEVQVAPEVRTWQEVEDFYPSYAAMEAEENWKDVQGYRIPGYDRNYTEVRRDFGTYAGMEGKTYAQIGRAQGVRFSGLSPLTGNRTAFTVRPRIHYADTYLDQERQAEDALAIRQVLNVLKPAGSKLQVNTRGVNLHEPVPIRGLEADSEHWEIISEVEPYVAADVDLANVYPRSALQVQDQVHEYDAHILPRPAFSGTAGEGWSYNTEVVAVSSFAMRFDGATASAYDYEIVAHYDGSQTTYGPDKGVMDPQQAESARLAGDGSLMCAPYSQERLVVSTHD